MTAGLGLARTQVESAIVASRLRAVLVGAAGVGKTSMARIVALAVVLRLSRRSR